MKDFKTFMPEFKLRSCSLNGLYTVNPKVAKFILDANTENYRNVDWNTVEKYTTEMKAGKWISNGETIVVGKNGILQDGQHRLHAVIKSKATIQTYIIFDADVTAVYDYGKARTIKNIFGAEGRAVSAINIATGKFALTKALNNEYIGNTIVHDYICENMDLIKKAESIVSTHGTLGKKAPCAALVYCFLKTGEISEADMRGFFTVLNSGNIVSCVKHASPALVLRNQLMEIHGGGRTNQRHILEITYKALHDFKANTPRTKYYSDDSLDGERFIKDTILKDLK